MILAISWIGWVFRVVVALFAIVGIFKIAPPAEPDPAQVVAVDLKFRCTVCGAEVVMTAAQADTEIDAPRHCREDMVLVSD